MTEKLKNVSEVLNSIQKNLKAPKGQKNSFGNYVYRKAEDILEAYKKEIEKEEYPRDLSLKHRLSIELIGGRFFLKCVSVLSSGNQNEEAEGFAEIGDSQKGMTQAQLTGAVTSYAKKYALGNLFAIDDSKDDPDSKEEPEKKEKPAAKNATGLKAGTPPTEGEDMKETLNKKNEQDFAGLKSIIENCGSLEELTKVRNDKENIKIVNSLKKWRPELATKLAEAVKYMEKELAENDPILDQIDLHNGG